MSTLRDRPPDPGNGEARVAAGSGKAAELNNSTATIPQTGTAAQWQVQVVDPAGRVRIWSTFPEREPAESVARKLRRHGFFTQVRRVDDADGVRP